MQKVEITDNTAIDVKCDVMPFFYHSGEQVKENDIVFYSEHNENTPKGNDFHYADSIKMITKNENNELILETYVITNDDAKTFVNFVNDFTMPILLKYYCNEHSENPQTLTDCKKIGEYPKDDFMLQSKYANEFFSIFNKA